MICRILSMAFAIFLVLEPVAMSEEKYSMGVKPIDEKNCPATHPIKAKVGSRRGIKTKIYHLPRGWYYEITMPTICYATTEDAIKDGFRIATRGFERLKLK